MGSILVALILLLVIAFWLVSKEKYQNLLAQKGAQYLSEKLKTKVEINRVSFTFFNHFNLKGVYIEDNYKDTLAYIGNIQLRTSELLSNYWNNSKPVIKNITLENVYVNLNRKKDSTWNYDFISSAFQSDTKEASQTIEPKSTTNESPKNPEIDLKNIICKNIRFFMNDGWRGEDMNFTFQKLELSTNEIDLSKKNLNLEAIDIEGADIAVREYDGYKPEDLTPDDTTDWGTPFNPDLYKINLKRFHLSNSKFSYIDGNEIPNPKEFDEKNIVINNLNLDLDNTRIVSDTIFSSITKLSANERCGLVIKELRSDVKLSQVHASLNNLLLKTNYSTIGHHYEMNYKNFHDFNDYINKVNMKANISNTNVSSLDIGYFANILNEYPISINLAGSMDGTVDNLVGKNISLQTRNTSFKGDATVIGLPDIEKTYFDITNIILSTSGKDLNALIPQTRTDGVAWDQLSKINYTGSYKGMVDQFYTKGNLNTSLGNALLDLDMDFKPKYPSYAGHIETDNFDIGKLIKQTSIGKISMKGKIDGSGFDLENLNAKVDATVSSLEVDSNRYVNMTINGIVANKKFDGIFISQDPSLAVNFNGKLDLSGKQPVYNFNSRFIRFDLKKLGLTKESMIGSGYASLNFTGSTLDNFTGTALLKNITIENKDRNIYLNEVLLESTQVANEKILRLTSSIADAEVKGNFYLSGLPNAIQLYLYHYLPQYIKMPTSMSNQELVYKVELKNIDTIINTFMPDIHGLSGSVISGNLNTNTQLFSLDANILSFGYKEFELKNIVIVGAGDYSEFDINTTCGYFLYKNDVIIPSFQINGIMANDTASLSIITQSMNEVLGDAFINLKATALNKNLYVNILPSNVTIKDDKWQLYGSDDIVLGKKILVSNLIFESGAQKITINTKNSETNDLVLDINEIDLESFSNYINQTKPSIYGRLSGRVEVDNFTENPLIDATIYSTNEVRIDADTLGLVNAKIKYNTEKNVLTIDKGTQILHGVDKATVDGFVNLRDSTIQLNTVLANTSIAFANRFISDFVKDMTGRASGNVNIRGAINNPRVSGNMVVNDASLKIIYLGTRYSMNDVKLNFDNEKINIEDFYLHDERKGNYTALVKGYIQHKNFDDIQLNLNVSSSNLLCLNTMEWDNDLFYGFVPAQMTASAKGYLDDLTLDINAKPLKGSSFHMPI
ncbi:MAG TPA: translocation/assembly module TamB domain-containing protein, partial [Chitinophagaceae bacterium]|nr:translocation/assembly module TamB domain-containing protein [Chitinophagaceae bacterium]